MNNPILIPQDTWLNSPLSVARHYGGIMIQGQQYYIEGTDLVHNDFIPFLRKLGRDRFIAILKSSTEQRVAQPFSTTILKRLMHEAIKAKTKAIPSPQPSLFD